MLEFKEPHSVLYSAAPSGVQGWRNVFRVRFPDSVWVEFVVGSLRCSERFFSGFSGFPLSSKSNNSKFQFDLDYCQALYHEPLAWVIPQALTVFDIKYAFFFTF